MPPHMHEREVTLGRLLDEVLGRFLWRLLGEGALIAGVLLAVSFWFLDYAVIEWRRRRLIYSLLCGAIGGTIFGLLFLGAWSAADLVRAGVAAVVIYLPLHLWSRRHEWDPSQQPSRPSSAEEQSPRGRS